LFSVDHLRSVTYLTGKATTLGESPMNTFRKLMPKLLSRFSRLGLAAILLAAALFASLGVTPVLAGPGAGWTYQRLITLSAATPANNFQIRVQITDHSNMNPADGRDLRFYDANDVQADFWIETWNTAGTSTVWVEVPTAGTTSLTMYYGNGSATAASNGDNTFIFFDDFPGTTVNATKWSVYDPNASITVSGGSVTVRGEDQMIGTTSFAAGDGVIVESALSSDVTFRAGSRASISGASSLFGSSQFFGADFTNNSFFAVWSNGRNGIYGINLMQYNGGGTGYYQYPPGWGGPDTWNANGGVVGTAFETGLVSYFYNFGNVTSMSTGAPSGTLYPLINNGLLGQGLNNLDPFSITTFRVRRFVSSYNPAVTVGAAISTVTAGASGGDGPGGVGITDGSSSLELWLRADRGVYVDTGCSTTQAANGSNVGCWQDQSGNASTNAIQGTGVPTYQTNSLNGQPVLSFNGGNSQLVVPRVVQNDFTIISLFRTGQAAQYCGALQWYCGRGLVDAEVGGVTIDFGTSLMNGYAMTGAGNPDVTIIGPLLNNNAGHMFFSQRTMSSGQIRQFVDGANTGNTAGNTASLTASPRITIGSLQYDASYFQGDVPEIILFSNDLLDVDRILVENYLSAKYNVALSANDVYDGDTLGNGDFDLDMAGIGRFGGNNHTQSHSVGMIVVNRTFLQDNGDWLTFGHLTPAAGRTNADLPITGAWATTPAPQRWTRHWYFDRTDVGTSGGTVDIIFDFSEGRMNGSGESPTGPASNYRLLRRATPTGTFDDIATATAIVGDQVQFIGVDVTLLGSNFTLGTLDDTSSPTTVTLTNLKANAASGDAPFGLVLFALTFAGLGSYAFLRRKANFK
jgi:hypothetical protein